MRTLIAAGFLAFSLVGCCCAGNKIEVARLSERAEGRVLSVELNKIVPWCDHMPIVGPDERRQYLILVVTLKNKTDQPLKVNLIESRFRTEGDKNDVPSDSTMGLMEVSGEKEWSLFSNSISLAPYQVVELEIRGDGLFAEGVHGKKFYVRLTFIADHKKLTVVGSSVIRKSS